MATQSTEALQRALGTIVGDARRQVETYRLQSDAIIAALNARVAETETRLSEMEKATQTRIAERMASVRDGTDVDMDDVARRIDAAVAAIPPPKDGKDADPEMIRAMVEEAVAAIPPAQDGKDADPEVIRGMVAEAVAEIPPPNDGKDADPEVIRAMVAEAVAKIPPAKDGKDADPDDVVERVMAKLPTRDELRGPPGRLPVAREWSDEVHYEGAVVLFDGGTYQAIRDTGRDPTHDDWVCLAAPGAEGAGYSWRGTFDPLTDYRARDIVMCNGSAWAAMTDDPGKCPGDGWHLWASRGGKGDRGPGGERGEPGATISNVDVDDQGIVTFSMSDGRKIKTDLYPILSKFKT